MLAVMPSIVSIVKLIPAISKVDLAKRIKNQPTVTSGKAARKESGTIYNKPPWRMRLVYHFRSRVIAEEVYHLRDRIS